MEENKQDSTAPNKSSQLSEEELLSFLLECKKSGIEYRNQFKPTWDECEKQVRCVLPDSYSKKEDWQTKIFIPLQAKASETAVAYLGKMVFGKTVNFDITGVEGDDTDDSQNLTTLISTLMNNGDFQFQNKFVLNEGVDIGTGFIKLVMVRKGKLKFLWRSAYSCFFDPKCGHNIDNARFWGDQYEKDISWVLQEARNQKSIYKKDALEKFLDEAVAEAAKMKDAGQQVNQDQKQAFQVVKSIDGTNDISIPSKYSTVSLDEYWVSVPDGKGMVTERVISVLNDRFILRNDENVFGFKPTQWMRIKIRKYDSYGKGYIENTRGLQELSNSCINLGFDSLKISSMDIIILDETKVKDPTTIKYKPLAVWKMRDINGVKIQRQPISAVGDVLRGVTLIDQIHQDATGVSRGAQGAPELSGQSASSNTLGEYKLQLQAIDQRFLDIGRFIEQDYVIPLVKKVFKVVANPKLFTQDDVNRILGMKEQDNVVVENGQVTKQGTIEVPKLDITKIQKVDEMELDFKPVGVTQFTDKMETLSKLKEALQATLQDPTLKSMTKVDVLWKKLWQASEIPDYDEFLKSKDEIMQSIQQQPMPGMPPQGGVPQLQGIAQ